MNFWCLHQSKHVLRHNAAEIDVKSKKNRKLLLKVFGPLYSFKYLDDRLRCVYCADVREHLDHIPPLSALDKFGTKQFRKNEIEFMTVPSCKLCNTALGSRLYLTYEDRLVFLYNRIIDKIEKTPIWSDDEMDELGSNLKQMIKARQEKVRRDLLARLRSVESNLADIENTRRRLEST